MGEPSTQADGPGERRRRREADRAQGGAATGSRPLTRRELRARELEEQARLEAIASGELQLGDAEGSRFASPASPSGQSPQAVPTAQSSSAVPSGQTPPLAPTAFSASAVPSAYSASQTPTAQSPSAVPSAHSSGYAGSTDHAPSAGSPGGISRRAMRDRLRDAPEEPTPRSAPTAGGRRPVRTPPTARGIRTLEPTGRLSGVQPVVRDDDEGRGGTVTRTAVRHGGVTSADPAAWEPARDLPPAGDATVRSDAADGRDEPDDEPHSPALTALKYLLLIVAGVVIGALVAVLAFSDIGPAGAAAVGEPGGMAVLVASSGA